MKSFNKCQSDVTTLFWLYKQSNELSDFTAINQIIYIIGLYVVDINEANQDSIVSK